MEEDNRGSLSLESGDLLVLPTELQLLGEAPCEIIRVENMPEPSVVLRRQILHMGEKKMGIKGVLERMGLVEKPVEVQEVVPEVKEGAESQTFIVRGVSGEGERKVISVQTSDGVVREVPVGIHGEEQDLMEGRRVIRHIRPHEFFLAIDLHDAWASGDIYLMTLGHAIERVPTAKGGATLLFEVNAEGRGFKVALATCHEDDLFNKKLATTIANNRLDSSDHFVVDGYDSSYSLILNFYKATAKYLNRELDDRLNAEAEGLGEVKFTYVPVTKGPDGSQVQRLSKVFDLLSREYIPS